MLVSRTMVHSSLNDQHLELAYQLANYCNNSVG